MRLPALLSFLTLFVVALSGCAEEEPVLKEWRAEPEETKPLDAGADNGTAPDAGGSADNATAPTGPAPNAPPTASLSMAPNGSAPHNVTFLLDGTDADGDALNWTFTVGNVTANGTALPATVNATLEPGNWTATLTVSDGRNETAAVMEFTLGGGSGFTQKFTGTWLGGPYGCLPHEVHEPGLPAAALLYSEVALRAEAVGLPFTAVYDALTDTQVSAVLDFFDGDGALVSSSTADGAMTVAGTVPDGAAWAVFSTCGVEGSAVTFQVG